MPIDSSYIYLLSNLLHYSHCYVIRTIPVQTSNLLRRPWTSWSFKFLSLVFWVHTFRCACTCICNCSVVSGLTLQAAAVQRPWKRGASFWCVSILTWVRFGIIDNGCSLINFCETSKFDYMNSGFVKGWCSSSSRGKWVAVTTTWHVVGFPMEEPLQICRVVSDILNKHSRTADRGWFSSLAVGWDAKNFSP